MAEDLAVCTQCGARNRLRTGIAGAIREGQTPVCGRCRSELPWLVTAGDRTFDRELDAPTPVLVDFWAPWCGPCHTVAPVLEELARELAGRLKVVKVNVDENPQTAGRFQVQGIPMLLVFRGGQAVESAVGAQPKSALVSLLRPYL